ncbi:hypothetical protein L2E82_39136 [Cichorium intybus]|uniref:Uncharacterized protein n=1 Tax=Cichorium intybus TaxID=13427 RepID=A0ACB9ALR4_CICIN|nr:hypothetical protein L2E82_39136 [Cichorium intybus]
MSSSSNSDSGEDNDDHGYVVDEELVDETWEDDGKCKESCIDPFLNMLCDDKKLVKSKHNEKDSKDENVIDDDDDFQKPYKPVWAKQDGVRVQEGVGVPKKNDAFEEESVMVEEQGTTIQEEGDGVKEGICVQEEGIGFPEGVTTEEMASAVAQMLDDIEDDDEAEDERKKVVRLLRNSGYENNEIIAVLQEHIDISVPEDASIIDKAVQLE